jgi:hypothetical protein
MAFTVYHLDRVERTQMYQLVRPGVLVELPFDKLLLDGTTYVEPLVSGGTRDPKGQFPRGVVVAQEIYEHPAPALPVAARPTPGQMAVWQYGGI